MTDMLDKVRRALAADSRPSSDFDLNPDFILPEGRVLRPAGVLVPLIDGPAGLEVILTKRSSALKHHPGQIAFPGGKQDEGDATVVDAALREAQEEIALPTALVDVMGTLPHHETVTNFLVTPVVAHVRAPFDARPEPGEVAEVFRVPLAHVADPTKFVIEGRMWRGHKRHYFTVPYGPYYIWGATARILRGLADRLAP
ncbi:MAG: CoA pyrophosphatase [Roseivivax sp.]|nr:CoA pyrophosphatase [Roseivivax sp.]